MSSHAINTPSKVLAVDDNPDALQALVKILEHGGHEVLSATSGAEALQLAKDEDPALILLDVMMPELSGYDVARTLKSDANLRFIPLILLTANDSLDDIVEGLDQGADGYLCKPFNPEELFARVRVGLRQRQLYQELRNSEQKNVRLLEQLSAPYKATNIIGNSAPMQKLFKTAEKLTATNTAVLITGPSGTGKELIARSIHFNSQRSDQRFLAKNCAAFPESLLESELFGHIKGAFTGANSDKEGLFEAAHGGTLFLDEVGEMPLAVQAKLLRVLEDGVITPVGTTEERVVDVRILAATNRELSTMVEKGHFRDDLYYRLNVITLNLPPLKDRSEDIPLLVDHFLNTLQPLSGIHQIKSISPAALEMLIAYRWPGNVRELQNEIERMLILGSDQEELGPELLSSRVVEEYSKGGGGDSSTGGVLKQAVEEVERKLILEALQKGGWNKTSAAKELGISRSNLIAKVKQFGLEK